MAPIVSAAVEFLKVPVGTVSVLDGYMLKPKAFDASKKYPVVVYVYGEPANTTVNDAGATAECSFTAPRRQGYIVVSSAHRGTPALKGAAWRRVVIRTVGSFPRKNRLRR